MPKTTKGDGMDRRAERWLCQDVHSFKGLSPSTKEVQRLTRLLRKVAREAARKQRIRDAEIAWTARASSYLTTRRSIRAAILNDKDLESA